jgi:hypothetical protein
MNRELLQQALNALLISAPLGHAMEDYEYRHRLIKDIEAELANYEEPLPPVDIGVDVTPEGTHVVACYNRPDAVQEMFYSQFHPLAKPEQEPVAQIRIKNGYWIDTPQSQVNHLPNGLHDLYIAPPRKPWVGLTKHEIWECQKPGLSDDVYKLIEAKLKEKNT